MTKPYRKEDIVYYYITDDEMLDPVQLRIDVSWDGVYADSDFQNWSIDMTERGRKVSERALLRQIRRLNKVPVKLTYEQYKVLPDFPDEPRPGNVIRVPNPEVQVRPYRKAHR